MQFILGIIAGLVILVPGFSVIQSIKIGELFGANNIITIFVAHIVGTIKDCNYIAGSDNYPLIAASNFTKTELNSVLITKICVCITGILVGLGLGVILPTATGSILFTLIIGGLLVFTSSDPIQAAMYVCSCGVFFFICNNITTDLVLVGGICILGIPATIKAITSSNTDAESGPDEVNPIVLSIGSVVALFTPGVSSSALLSTLGSQSALTALMTDIFIDAIALGLLITNVESGKSIISMASSYADIGTAFAVIVAIALAFVITITINPFYVEIIPQEIFLGSSLIMNLVILVMTIGVWAIPLLALGFAIDLIGSKRTRGLVFLAPILFL